MPSIRYDEDANGHEIKVAVQEEFEIALAETRTAGYGWTLKKSGEPACHLEAELSQPNLGAVGGSGTRIWRFRAVQPGDGRIELAYDRSWKTGPEPARTFVLKVRVVSGKSK